MSSFHTRTVMDYLRASKPESERDSGFSDASSGYLSAVDLTDSEDTGGTRTRTQGFLDPQSSPHVALMGGSYPGLSPMILVDSVVLKQPSSVAPELKPWGFSSSLEMVPQSQVVLLQPMINNNNNSSSPKSASDNNRQPRSYLPILKSYPKIAPYPGHSSSGMQVSVKRGSSTPGRERRHSRRHHGQRVTSASSPLPGTQTPLRSASNSEPPNTEAPSVNGPERGPPQPPDRPPTPASEVGAPFYHHNQSEASAPEENGERGGDGSGDILSMDDARVQRFCNTYNILNRSGLLGATLRTKELMRRNRRTQAQLRRLREHTALLTEALESGDPRVWTRLQLTLQEDGTAETEREEPAQGAEPQGILA